MTLRMSSVIKGVIVVLSIVLAFGVDQSVTPHVQFVATPFAISVLLAASWFSRRGVLATVALAVIVAAFSAYIDRAPLVPALFHLASLLIIGTLAILLAEETRTAAQRAHEAEAARTEITSIVHSITDAFFAVDRDWRLSYLNREAARLLGRRFAGDLSELLGKNLWTTFPDLEGTPVARTLRQAMTERTAVSLETFLEPPAAWLDVRIYPAPNGLSMHAKDVTDRKKAEEERERLLAEVRRERQHAQDLAAQTEQVNRTLTTVIDTIPAGVLLSDARGSITLANPAANAILGGTVPGTAYGPSTGYTLLRLDGSPFPARELPLPQAIERGVATHDIEILIRHQDGTECVISAAGSPERDSSGRITGAVAVMQDITVRKRAEDERERLLAQVQVERARLQAIFECAFNGIVYLDARTGRVLANAEAVRVLGRPIIPEAGRSQYIDAIRYPDGRPIPVDDLPSSHALRGEKPYRSETLIVRPDGSAVPILDNAAPVRLPDGTIIGAVIISQDISALKTAERLREEWTSLVAHDLRQPVTIISGYADMLAKQAQMFPQPARSNIGHIVTSARLLNRMIGDLLDVSRIEARRLTLTCEKLDFPTLLREVVARAAEITAGHPVRLEVSGTIPPLEADPVRIEQVLGNILSNAAKYGEPNTDIVIEVCRHAGEVEVSVTNTGPGIPPEHLPRLFTRFYRTPSAQVSRVAGLGVGLYISKGLIEAHGGRIWADSIPGKTTTFHFTLPLSPRRR